MTPATAKDSQALALYDSMMRVINADLTSDQAAKTMKRRKGESEADYNDRLEQYAADFFMADQAIAELHADFDMQAFLQKAEVNAEKSETAQAEDKGILSKLEDQFSDSK